MARATYITITPDIPRVVGPVAQERVRVRALRVLSYAKGSAPVDTGEYRDSIHMLELPSGGFRIQADAPHSIFVEFGTSRMSAYHTLAVALDAAKGP
jgi:hypothetical protein